MPHIRYKVDGTRVKASVTGELAITPEGKVMFNHEHLGIYVNEKDVDTRGALYFVEFAEDSFDARSIYGRDIPASDAEKKRLVPAIEHLRNTYLRVGNHRDVSRLLPDVPLEVKKN